MSGDAGPLVRKLESIVELAPEEREGLRTLPLTIRDLRPQQDIVHEGDRPTQSCLVLEGFALRYKLVGGHRRQILAFHIPGEIPDLQSLHLKTMDHSLATLTAARIGFIQHRALHDLMARHPRLTGVFWRETLIDAAIFREWMVGLGRRRAPARIAHFFCEMFVRLDAIGLAKDRVIRLPVTQEELGDALGLSAVHTNRSLQELRSQNLFTFEGGRLVINDWEGLKRAADFDPLYLHQGSGGDAP
ncbi:Crp/Fnr family transcriptional regulator [Enterovirga aerilata]|uniref:Crp/Fnr family transcriptional regulator n=1 Tax=Enterovirga aerilata TaxID=2730920 RepID=A0A849IFQ1_9HYPH|nr:Crp/Fnr family transcriptional regulator [Enterovirga sp. DB1703]NNM72733.1 Crp/Fnr family transcriptional regulator [Enterovirga sp. DB1703]